jgi:hypothetical protein
MNFVYINGIPMQLGSPLPVTIQSFIISMPPMPVQFPSDQVPQLKQWLNSIIDRLTCSHFTYNNVLIPIEDLIKFPL